MLNFWKFEITQVFGFSMVIVLTQIEQHEAFENRFKTRFDKKE